MGHLSASLGALGWLRSKAQSHHAHQAHLSSLYSSSVRKNSSNPALTLINTATRRTQSPGNSYHSAKAVQASLPATRTGTRLAHFRAAPRAAGALKTQAQLLLH